MAFPEISARLAGLFRGKAPISIAQEMKADGGDLTNLGWYIRNGYTNMADAMSSSVPAWSGEQVSVDTALNHSVFWACNRIVSESVAMTPAILMRRKGDYTEEADKHPMYEAVRNEPNCEMTSQEWREAGTSHAGVTGNSFSRVIRRSGTGIAIELHPLQPSQVQVDREKTRQKRLVYVVSTTGEPDKDYPVVPDKPLDILHVRGLTRDGIVGMSVLAAARHSIGTALAAERHVGRFYANGGRVPYNLKLSKRFESDEAARKFRSDWESMYREPNRAPMLEPWLEYEKTGLSAVDSQMLETRQYTIPEMCRWWRVSPHLVHDLSRATFANIEQLGIEFVTQTLTAWFTRWESALRRCVLTPEEKSQGYYWTHDTALFLRGDLKSRFEAYASALQNGHLNVDEVRKREGNNPLKNRAGQAYHIQLNMATLPGTGEPMVSEQGILAGIDRQDNTDSQDDPKKPKKGALSA